MSALAPWLPPADDEELRADAERLRALVRECVTAGIARRALLVRLSRLPEAQTRPHHLRLARAALDPLSFADRARRFRLPNGDLAMVWRGEARAALNASVGALLRLFADEDDQLPDPENLVVVLDLPAQANVLLLAAGSPVPRESQAPAAPVAPLPTGPLNPPTLTALEAALAQADVAHFIRRHRICERLPDGEFRLRWEKRSLSVAEIAATLSPEREVRTDAWLFRRLTRTLDRRMLALLSAPEELADAGPFGLNLNVASVLGPEFLRFDAALPAGLRGRVVIELQAADVMCDLAAFMFARDFAHGRGYRLLLRGVTAELVDAFPLPRIGLDMLQLPWSPELAHLDRAGTLPDAAHTVLSRADTEAALTWGTAQGITLFRGRAVVPAHLDTSPSRRPRTGPRNPLGTDDLPMQANP